MEVQWSEKETEKLISGLINKPELWNKHDESYLNRDKKKVAVQEILLDLKALPEAHNKITKDVRTKIRTIRSQYRKEMKAIERSKKTGCRCADAVKKPTSGLAEVDALQLVVHVTPIDTTKFHKTSTQANRKRKPYAQFLTQGADELVKSINVTPGRGLEWFGVEVVGALNALRTNRAKMETVAIIHNALHEGSSKDKHYVVVPNADISSTELECALSEEDVPMYP